jgi:hypothetical protein
MQPESLLKEIGGFAPMAAPVSGETGSEVFISFVFISYYLTIKYLP